MPVIRDPAKLHARRGTGYPAEFATGFERRIKRPLTEALGLTQFGVNLTTLEPGAMSSLRHWHAHEDECVYVLEGEVVLITDEGECVLQPGMVAGFPAGEANGHHLINRSTKPATYLEIGTRSKDEDANYSDVDLRAEKRDGRYRFVRKSGEPYE
jgi:uncharacterized cupin superfamily protein